ncbi:NCK-interacting protein with SH3 domain isoform X1 [Dermacentor andersoni]|uniref:NCK-interacting protein with SH3 domain isoform X1 n=2 Tax=Dermacentor TaxID=34619 RepID=UPI002155A97E|nr:NCK-interacting protein with SH3 domain-like isoform X1 [Dermacentor andersoni]
MASAYQAKSLYDFDSKDKRLLSFKQDEKFIVIEQLCKDPNWYYAVSEKGIAGFVPVTYILREESEREEFLELVEKALEALQNSTSSLDEGNTSFMSLQRKALRYSNALLRLHHLKESLRSTCEGPLRDTPRETALGHQSPSDFLQEEYSRINSDWISENLAGADLCSLEPSPRSQPSKRSASLTAAVEDPHLPTLAAELIEQVRSQTQLSHSLSRVAVLAVLRCLSTSLPDSSCPWEALLDSVLKAEECEKPLVASQDGDRLQLIFRRLWNCKNDDQQRSWPIHEDEALILGLLEELYTILVDADPRVSRSVVQADEYDCVSTLALYYQMEPRASLRVWMLRVFLTLCELDLQVVSLLLHSVLPMELARDLQSNTDDIERMKYTALLLTVIFSTGEKPPNNVYEHVGEQFVTFLLDTIESVEMEEEVAELSLGSLLSLNLHLQSEADNFVLRTLATRKDARALTERLMLLVNREDDPARVLTHEVAGVPNSVLKMLAELFSDSTTAELFYLNDVAVLVDIVARQLSDLPPGDKRRLLYLSLVEHLLGSTQYEGHRQVELRRCFEGALAHDESSAEEKEIVRRIQMTWPQWFRTD